MRFVAHLTACALALALTACDPRANPGMNSDRGETDSDGDSDTTTGSGIAAYHRCFAQEDCQVGLECVEMGAASYCLRSCSGPLSCAFNERCLDGHCLHTAEHNDVCETLSACPTDSLCQRRVLAAPSRCVPICDAGDLGPYDTVATCPALPQGIDTAAPTCTPGAFEPSNASLCTAEVAVGELCDQLLLRCNVDDLRPDSDELLEAAGDSYDPGALACLPRGATSLCQRVCTIDGGTEAATCACPSADPLCHNPTDAGLAWACVRYAGLPTGLGVCAPVEACTSGNSACADNTVSQLTHCQPSPYEDGPTSICARP